MISVDIIHVHMVSGGKVLTVLWVTVLHMRLHKVMEVTKWTTDCTVVISSDTRYGLGATMKQTGQE